MKDEETNCFKKINQKNLDKVLRLRQILNNRANDEIDFYLTNYEPKLKKIKNDIEDDFILTLHKLGPPSFLKTKFKNITNKTY